jgi:hypothetical protein
MFDYRGEFPVDDYCRFWRDQGSIIRIHRLGGIHLILLERKFLIREYDRVLCQPLVLSSIDLLHGLAIRSAFKFRGKSDSRPTAFDRRKKSILHSLSQAQLDPVRNTPKPCTAYSLKITRMAENRKNSHEGIRPAESLRCRATSRIGRGHR